MDRAKTSRVGMMHVGVYGAILSKDAGADAPEWIELLPAGDFSGRDGRGPFRLSDASEVIASTDALTMEAGIPIDYDHATDFAAPEGRPAPAAGWIKELAERDGSVWGRVEWTAHGAAAVATHEYRYISPVFEYARGGEVKRLLRAALTNNPNLYLTAISAGELSTAEDHDGDEQAMETLAQVRAALNLADDATPQEVIAAVREAARQAHKSDCDSPAAAANTSGESEADPARYVPVAHFQRTVGELNALRAAHARERAERTVGDAIRSGKLIPAQREWAVAYCQADFRGFQTFVARQPAVALGEIGFEGEPRGLVSHSDGADGSHSGGRILTASETAVCAQLGIRAEEFVRRRAARDDLGTLLQRAIGVRRGRQSQCEYR